MKLYLYAAGLIAALALLGGLYAKGRIDGRNAAEKTYQASLAQAVADAAKKELAQASDTAAREAEQLQRVRELETRVAALMQPQSQPIRLCQPAASGRVPSASPAAAEPDAAAASTGHDLQDGAGAVSGGPDLRLSLVQYAEDAEACRQQLIALQAWVRQTATP